MAFPLKPFSFFHHSPERCESLSKFYFCRLPSALPSAHYHPRTYVNTEGVTGVQFPPILGPAAQTQGNSLQVSLSISGVPTCIDRCKGHQYVKTNSFRKRRKKRRRKNMLIIFEVGLTGQFSYICGRSFITIL